ncbi:MAG: hypothetical protein M5U26_21710 [Planctomycetota bacterium]|nr:hypothetical protein [Planctomycetota bacterium]
MRKLMLGFASLVLAFALVGCGRGSKQDVMKKAEGITKKADLESKLGKPDKFDKAGVGPLTIETWTYNASDGEVVFVITGDTVALKASGNKEKKE